MASECRRRRLVETNGYSIYGTALSNRCVQKLTSTLILGTEVRKGFLDSGNQKFIGLTGTLGKDNQLGMSEATNEFVKPSPRPNDWRKWQADHVQDLGLYATIARQGAPAGIAAKDWQTIQDAILGEDDACPSTKQTD